MRFLAAAGGIVVATVAIGAGGTCEHDANGVLDLKAMINRAIPSADLRRVQPMPRWPVFEWPGSDRAEFRPGAVARGEADEPCIAHMTADATAGVEINATVAALEVAALEPIRLSVEVKNVLDRECAVPTAGSNPYLRARLRVFDTMGKLLPFTRFYQVDGRMMNERGGGMSLFASLRLTPGDSFRADLIPNLLYDMTLPGEYWVLVEYPCLRMNPAEGRWESGVARCRPIKVQVRANPTQFGMAFQRRDSSGLPGVNWGLGDTIAEADVIVVAEILSTGSSEIRPKARNVFYPQVMVQPVRVLKGKPSDLGIQSVCYTVDTGRFESAPVEGDYYIFLLRKTERGYQAIKIERKTRENQDAIRAAVASR